MTKNNWGPKGRRMKKTSIGKGRGSRFKGKGSAENPSKGYRKKPRGQGRGRGLIATSMNGARLSWDLPLRPCSLRL